MPHAERHRLLVEALAATVRPVRPLWPVRVRLGLWLLLESIVLLWVATHTGNDFMRKLGHLDYALEVAFFAAAATLAAMMALRVAIPGRSAGPREVALADRAGADWNRAGDRLANRRARAIRSANFCTWASAAHSRPASLAALPWMALWWAVKRGAPMRGAAAGRIDRCGRTALLFCTDANRMPDRRAFASRHMASAARARADRALRPGGRRVAALSPARSTQRMTARGVTFPALGRTIL